MLFKKLRRLLLASETNKKIFSYGSYILAGNIVSKFSLLIAAIVIAKFLGKEEYGQFGIIKSTILTFSMIAGLELGVTATKYVSQYRKIDKKRVEKIVGLSNLFAIVISITISSLIFYFARDIAAQIKAPGLYQEIQVSSYILFFSAMNGIQNGILAGLEKFKEISINNVIAGFLSAAALILSAAYFGLQAVVIAFGLNFIILLTLNFITLRKHFYPHYSVKILDKGNFKEISVIYKFSLPAILAGLMVAPVSWYCNYLLVRQPSGYSYMAEFDIATQWRNTILFIPAALSQVALPMLSALTTAGTDQYKTVLKKNLIANTIIGVTLVILCVAGAPLIIKFYGKEYQNALVPLILMFLTTGFIAVNNVVGQAIASKNKMWMGFYFNFIWASILVGLSYVFIVIMQLGAVGISAAYLISYLCHTLLQFLYLRKIVY